METTNSSKNLPKQVIVMRKDLNMRKGKMMAQASHASMSFLLCGHSPGNDQVEHFLSNAEQTWVESGTKKVVVGCNSEAELLELYFKAKLAGVEVYMVTDHGYTEFHGVPTNTCLAIGPDWNEKIDPLTKHLALL